MLALLPGMQQVPGWWAPQGFPSGPSAPAGQDACGWDRWGLPGCVWGLGRVAKVYALPPCMQQQQRR